MPGKQVFLKILRSLGKAGSQCHMTNIIPVIMLAFQTRVMGDRQASGLETDSTEGRTVKDTICKGFNDDRKDNCPHCGKIFWSRKIMENHIQFHGLSCLICGQAFKHEGNWPDQVLHIKRHNRTAQFEYSDKKTYNCFICAKPFRGPSALKHYFKIHIDVRAFSCNLCPISFASKTQLENHIRMHTGDKAFLYNSYGHCFITRGQLELDKLNRHVGVRQCGTCEKSFAPGAGLESTLSVTPPVIGRPIGTG